MASPRLIRAIGRHLKILKFQPPAEQHHATSRLEIAMKKIRRGTNAFSQAEPPLSLSPRSKRELHLPKYLQTARPDRSATGPAPNRSLAFCRPPTPPPFHFSNCNFNRSI